MLWELHHDIHIEVLKRALYVYNSANASPPNLKEGIEYCSFVRFLNDATAGLFLASSEIYQADTPVKWSLAYGERAFPSLVLQGALHEKRDERRVWQDVV